ncbi:MAG: hypothetical protein WAO07_20875, partial [Desulfobacterales bacterium]
MVNNFFYIFIEKLPETRVAFNQAGDIDEVFESLALSSFGIAPGFDLPAQGILQRGNPHQNAMNVRWRGPAWKVFVELPNGVLSCGSCLICRR